MRKCIILFPFLLLLLSCQNDEFQLLDETTQINVIKVSDLSPSPEQYQQEGELMKEVTSTETIDKVRHALEKANVERTESADLALPSYKIHFLEDNNIVLTLGYYPKDKNHDTDAFLSLEEDRIYRLSNTLSLVP